MFHACIVGSMYTKQISHQYLVLHSTCDQKREMGFILAVLQHFLPISPAAEKHLGSISMRYLG